MTSRADVCPPGGLVERVAAMHKARYGTWPADVLDLVRRCYGGVIPLRFHALAARLAAERPWELPSSERGYPTITLVERDGSIRAVFPLREEDEAP